MPESRLIVVFDTNVLIKIAGATAPRMRAVRQAWQQGRYVLAVSDASLRELERTLRYPKVRNAFNLSEVDIAEFIHEIRRVAVTTHDLFETARIEADPSDNVILACALESDADYIVSEDHHLRDLKYFQGVQIISLDHFRELIGV